MSGDDYVQMWTESGLTGCGRARYHYSTQRWIVLPGFYDRTESNRRVRVPPAVARKKEFSGKQSACPSGWCRCEKGRS